MKVLLGVAFKCGITCPSYVGKDYFASFSLACSRLTRDDYRLILFVNDELLEGVFGDHEEMWARALGLNFRST